MSYRTLVIDKVTYFYTIGKTHTKIKNVGVFKNEDIGHEVLLKEEYCECCGTPLKDLYPNSYQDKFKIAVTPADVCKKISAMC